MRRLPIIIVLLLLTQQALSLSIDEEYEQCKNDDGFGNTTLVCDVEKRLSERTVAKLTHLLTELKDKIPCQCENECKRPDGSEGYRGLLMVTNSQNTKSLVQSSKRIYEESGLGYEGCDHGLLLVYLNDTQQLATYRGADSFVLLTDADMHKLHELALKGTDGNDAIALQFLLQNYKEAVEPTVQKADNWIPVVGLIVALIVFLLILAVLVALFLSKYCCCCAKNKKEVYHVNTIPTYKTIEPLYVVTPNATNERFPPHSDAIYSTPYSGSPLPFPPPPGTSRPLTPSSTYRTRIVPMGAPPPLGTLERVSPGTQRKRDRGEYAEKKTVSNSSPPSSKVQRRIDRGEYAERKASPTPVATLRKSHDKGEYAERKTASVASDTTSYVHAPESLYATSTLPYGRDPYMPPINEAYGTIPRPFISPIPRDGTLRQSVLTESDLSFLDPNRKQETQTREDFIY